MGILRALCLLALGWAAVVSQEQEGYLPEPDPGADPCTFACTKEYEPICAANSYGAYKTFSNPCFLDLWNCQNDSDFDYRFDGECSDRPEETNESAR